MIKLRNLKVFEDFNERNVAIDAICKKYGITSYTINTDGSIDVDGDVDLGAFSLVILPLKFGRVSGSFSCSNNRLASLDGSPRYVGKHFNCSSNQLTTLEGAPSYVGGVFNCGENKLTSLRGCPPNTLTNLYCTDNQLTSLEGCPNNISGDFNCFVNQLTSLKGAPKQVGGRFYFAGNPLNKTLFDNERDIKYILANQEDYGIWNKDGSFNEVRFDMMMKEKDI